MRGIEETDRRFGVCWITLVVVWQLAVSGAVGVAEGAVRIWEGGEPSGIVWHTRLHKYIWVDDGGWLNFLDDDGTEVVSHYLGGDLEGVTVASSESDYVYVGVENPDSILEVHVWTGEVRRSFDLTAWMTGSDNAGLEALTFVADEAHGEGGVFYAGLQADGNIYKFSLPIVSSSSSTTVAYEGMIQIAGRTDLSGLCYHGASDTVYALFDTSNEIVRLSPDGAVLGAEALGGDDQEGIAIRGCEIAIAEDSSEIWVYPWTIELCDCPGYGDADGDCDVDLDDYASFQAAFTGPMGR